MELIYFIILLFIGWSFGTYAEQKHYKSIKERELKFSKKPVVSFEKNISFDNVEKTKLVSGTCVISIDFFKSVLAGFANIIGGRVISYESLIDRARREAILRMTKSAFGYNMIVNTKIETTTIGRSDKGSKVASGISVLVYGTALKVKKQ